MAQTLQLLSVISYAVAGVFLVLAVFFWFFFKIPTVIGDLTGRTARKSIAKMRIANESTGVKAYKQSKINAERGKVTGSIPETAKKSQQEEIVQTGLLGENKAESIETEQTAILDQETSILGCESTGLLVDENSTAPLDAPKQEPMVRENGKKIEMMEEIILIHTEETI